MSRTLLATICLSTAMIGGETLVSDAEASDSGHAGPQFLIGQSDPFGFIDQAAEDTRWLTGLAATDPLGIGADVRPHGGRLSIHSISADGAVPYGTAAVLDFGVVENSAAEPGYARFRAAPIGQPASAFTASLGTAAGLRFESLSAGAFSTLTYSRSLGSGAYGTPQAEFGDDRLTGSVGLQSTPRFETAFGMLEPQFRLSLDHDFDIGDGTGGPYSDLGRHNIYIEERDATPFDLDNAISLRMKGIVPGWFHYETRIRVRRTGIREVTGRIRFKW